MDKPIQMQLIFRKLRPKLAPDSVTCAASAKSEPPWIKIFDLNGSRTVI